MSKTVFCVPFQPGVGPVISFDLGRDDGDGYSCIGPVGALPTCLVLVQSDEETLDALAALPDVVFVEDVADA